MDLKNLIPENDTVTVTLKHPGNGATLQNEVVLVLRASPCLGVFPCTYPRP